MGANILQMGCQIKCPHGAPATVVTANTRVKINGQFALLSTDVMTIAGCTFQVGTVKSPCLTIQWLNEAKRVKVMGKPVLLETSMGLCKNPAGAPQGTAIISGVQTKVKGL